MCTEILGLGSQGLLLLPPPKKAERRFQWWCPSLNLAPECHYRVKFSASSERAHILAESAAYTENKIKLAKWQLGTRGLHNVEELKEKNVDPRKCSQSDSEWKPDLFAGYYCVCAAFPVTLIPNVCIWEIVSFRAQRQLSWLVPT